VPAATRRAWLESKVAARIKPGMRIAVGCGSRGIRNILPLARATIAALKELGAAPFVVAAMGSHGGATAAGQRELLASYSLDEAHLGVPVVTDMNVVQVGVNSWNQPVWWDRNAFQADGVVTISRVKPHTDIRGRYESGVVKMLVIGLGKRHGADQHHRFGIRGLRDMMPETAKVLLAKTPFLGGLAVLENAREETARVEVLDRDELFDKEPPLLEEARRIMGRLPFERLDVLVIGECGKNYAGTGIDTNVVGRTLLEEGATTAPTPVITRIGLLDISPESHGNATGIGIADLTTDRALAAFDPVPVRMNTLTARFLWRSKLPFGFPTDRECMEQCVGTCWQPVLEEVKFAVIPNSLEVAELWVSSPLAAEAKANRDLEVVGGPRELPFDAAGTLRQEELFPHSIRGRRATHQ
jgi:hypothetical protein